MKRLLFFICTLLCANVIFAQTFWLDSLQYNVTSTNQVEVYDANSSIITANITTTVTYQGITYSVTSIGESAFEYCDSLTSVTIPNSVTSIGHSAFYDCSSLTSVTIPNSVTSIGIYAFYGCSSLTSATIPNSVTYIGVAAFEDCSGLTTLNFNAINCEDFEIYYFGDSYYSGDNYPPFYNCPITTINIGDSVQRIPKYFAYNNGYLTSVSIPNSVTSIGDAAFIDCSALASISLPNSITYIGAYAFYNCSSLTSVNIGNSVTSIGDFAFLGCSSLTTLNFNAVNCNDFNSGSYYPFRNCPITTINIGNSVQRIPANFAYNLNSLTSVGLDMSSIPANLFPQSTALQNITFGENVASIASGAFSPYYFLQNITCLATTPPTLADNTVFPYPNIASLKVPCGTLEAYSSPTSFWNMFFNGRIEEDCTSLEDVEDTELSFYPNPTKSEITFSQAIEKVEVIDLTGKTIFTFSNAREINIESLPAGAYYLRLRNNDKAIMRKVIKE